MKIKSNLSLADNAPIINSKESPGKKERNINPVSEKTTANKIT